MTRIILTLTLALGLALSPAPPAAAGDGDKLIGLAIGAAALIAAAKALEKQDRHRKKAKDKKKAKPKASTKSKPADRHIAHGPAARPRAGRWDHAHGSCYRRGHGRIAWHCLGPRERRILRRDCSRARWTRWGWEQYLSRRCLARRGVVLQDAEVRRAR